MIYREPDFCRISARWCHTGSRSREVVVVQWLKAIACNNSRKGKDKIHNNTDWWIRQTTDVDHDRGEMWERGGKAKARNKNKPTLHFLHLAPVLEYSTVPECEEAPRAQHTRSPSPCNSMAPVNQRYYSTGTWLGSKNPAPRLVCTTLYCARSRQEVSENRDCGFVWGLRYA